MIRVILPHHLQTLAGCGREVQLELAGEVTMRAVLDALELCYPMLQGTVREHVSLKRRPRVRFFVGTSDVSLDPDSKPLPDKVASGQEPVRIVGAVAGG